MMCTLFTCPVKRVHIKRGYTSLSCFFKIDGNTSDFIYELFTRNPKDKRIQQIVLWKYSQTPLYL